MRSPLAYAVTQIGDVEVSAAEEAARAAVIAAIAIAADRILAGPVDWAEAGSRGYDTAAAEGANVVCAATEPLRLTFTVLGDAAG